MRSPKSCRARCTINSADLEASIRTRVAALASNYLAQVQEHSAALPLTDYDIDWPSTCSVGEPRAGQCHWRPAPMQPAPDFERLTQALDVRAHPALRAVYTTHWSASLPLLFNDNPFELLQLWNEQDFDNLLGNFIGHALEKKRVRQDLTFFFALVDDSSLLSIDNATGAVVLETLGRPGPEDVSPSLSDFLDACSVRLTTAET